MPPALPAVFIVGCPRSGTTWVQWLLAQHPEVATGQETHLFSRYLRRLDAAWREETERAPARRVGLSTLLSAADFDARCAEFARTVLAALAARTPDARLLVEKTPDHVLDLALIARLVPAARFVQVIRDPRDVVCSLVRAGRGWGRGWAPTGAVEGARWWCRYVEAGLAPAAQPARCFTLRYEDLHAEGPALLERLCAWLGPAASAAWCRETFDACRLERLQRGDAPARPPWAGGAEPAGFYGAGTPGQWRRELSVADRRVVEFLAAPLMERYGYPFAAGRPPRTCPWRLAARRAVEALWARVPALRPLVKRL